MKAARSVKNTLYWVRRVQHGDLEQGGGDRDGEGMIRTDRTC